ncbi:hypothetical protein HOY80DRAFT_1140463 [Tuber brumale]|nr:hypothetical protein HOY80DRAFT_1140463 [Tuber brumale]
MNCEDCTPEPETRETPPPADTTATGKFRLNARYAFVTWSKSTIDDKEEFHLKLASSNKEILQLYGGRELHEDGTPHYHAVIRFAHRVNWPDARAKFHLADDTEAIKIRVPQPRQPINRFLEHTQAYCERYGDTFGTRMVGTTAAAVEKKRRFQEIDREPDQKKAKRMLRDENPMRFIYGYKNVDAYLAGEKTKQPEKATKRRNFDVQPWDVPTEMTEWKRRYIDNEYQGRPRSLVIVGPALCGKTEWARSFGNPTEMTTQWNMAKWDKDMTHLVLNDVNPKKFGWDGIDYLKPLIGGQEEFEARDCHKGARTLIFGKPCIITCDKERDISKAQCIGDDRSQDLVENLSAETRKRGTNEATKHPHTLAIVA